MTEAVDCLSRNDTSTRQPEKGLPLSALYTILVLYRMVREEEGEGRG